MYNEDVMSAVRQSIGCYDGDDTSKDKEIETMSREEVFERYCKWNGLMGNWYQTLINAIESIFEVDLSE